MLSHGRRRRRPHAAIQHRAPCRQGAAAETVKTQSNVWSLDRKRNVTGRDHSGEIAGPSDIGGPTLRPKPILGFIGEISNAAPRVEFVGPVEAGNPAERCTKTAVEFLDIHIAPTRVRSVRTEPWKFRSHNVRQSAQLLIVRQLERRNIGRVIYSNALRLGLPWWCGHA